MPGDPGTAPLRRDRHRSDRPGGDHMKGRNTPEVAARFAQLNGIHRDEVDLDEANASVQTGAVLSHPRVLKKRKIPPARWAKPAKNPGKKTRPPPHQEPTPTNPTPSRRATWSTARRKSGGTCPAHPRDKVGQQFPKRNQADTQPSFAPTELEHVCPGSGTGG